MIDLGTQDQLKEAIADCIGADQRILDSLREEIRPLRNATRRIQPRATTSISLVGTDGGNNQLQFDPFLIQVVRVVDSSNNEYCLEAVSPTTPIQKLNERQFKLRWIVLHGAWRDDDLSRGRELNGSLAYDPAKRGGKACLTELGAGVP